MPRVYKRKGDGRMSPQNDTPTGNPMGRPKKYNEQAKDLARAHALLRRTDEQIAKALGICIRTFYNWCHEFPDFLHAIEDSRGKLEELAINNLYYRLQKRQIKEVHIYDEVVKDPKTGELVATGKKRRKTIIKDLEADWQAIDKVLSKRVPEFMDKEEKSSEGEFRAFINQLKEEDEDEYPEVDSEAER